VSTNEWDQHWADYGDPAEGSPANHYRTRLILDRLGNPGSHDTVVDIGSGQGELALLIKKAFLDARVCGIEYSAEGVRRATAAAETAALPIQFILRDLLEPAAVDPALKGKASFAVCSEVLEHLDEPETFLRNASKFLAPGCLTVITVPSGPRSAFDKHIGHRQHFRPRQLRQLLESCGFEVETVTRSGFPFFNLYRLVVVFRGRRLITDFDNHPTGGVGRSARAVLAFFDRAFRWNLDSFPLGWQLVAVARFRPSGDSP
jgi:2-polyprenyl-3-methyl-5-hydroxy-6-metoxy-1,4-benzoquinol methylase